MHLDLWRPALALIVGIVSSTGAARAAEPPAKPQQYVYVLRLIPRLHDDKAWTSADNEIVAKHFAQLKAATEAGQVILAGRTLESGEKTFGLVVFEAADAEAARQFMNRDPAVVGKIMTATLHPYRVALQRSAKPQS